MGSLALTAGIDIGAGTTKAAIMEDGGRVLAKVSLRTGPNPEKAGAEALAEVLTEAGAVGDRRDAVLRSLVAVAKEPVDRDELAEACKKLRQEVARLEARKASLESGLQELRTGLGALREEIEAARTKLAALVAPKWPVV